LLGLENHAVDLLKSVIASGVYLQGPQVAALEGAVEQAWGYPAVATNSGTTSLQIALLAAGVKPGDEVIVPALTFISTAYTVSAIGAIPVFVDVEPHTLTLDPACVQAAIRENTAAVIPVHQISNGNSSNQAAAFWWDAAASIAT
jgi:dTDP-4-amino-4,6-dideoxygalactose transaminase